MPVFLLSDQIKFPPPRLATREGLLAMGGDLSTERLLLAYRLGIFPWYLEGVVDGKTGLINHEELYKRMEQYRKHTNL